jgi:hypothetical protein
MCIRPGKGCALLLVGSALLGSVGCGGSSQAPPIDGGSMGDAQGSGDAPPDTPDVSPVRTRFTIDALTAARIGSENGNGWPNVGEVYADVDWKQGPFAAVKLAVDLGTTCYPFETWAANPPPSGQSVPADCDAFDRSFNAFIDDGPGVASPVPFEIMHAITPFGGPEHLEIDLTDLANALPGKHRLRVDLTSYSDGAGQSTGSNNGWTVSARVDVTPGEAPRRVLAAIPLYAGLVKMGDAWPVVAFDAPDGTVGGRLEYRTSGHGQGAMPTGCIGPAEEFCDRHQSIFVDSAQRIDIHPWRYDCATLCTLEHHAPFGPFVNGLDYCRENPLGLPSSVGASRANWCPGSMTPPYSWPDTDIPALAIPGPHTFSFQVSEIAAEGAWMVSAIYYAYGS